MSMISGQCDKLRETADEIQRIKNNNADWLWRDAITLADAAALMRDAADLILELRDDLQQANEAVRDAEHDESMAWDRVRKAEAENEKLRKLCSALYKFAYDEYPDGTELNFANHMRELGIEVDG